VACTHRLCSYDLPLTRGDASMVRRSGRQLWENFAFSLGDARVPLLLALTPVLLAIDAVLDDLAPGKT